MHRPPETTDASIVRTLQILWIGIFSAVLIYLLVAVLLERGRDPLSVGHERIGELRWIFLITGGICFVLAFRVREEMLGRSKSAGGQKARKTQAAFLVGWAFLDAIAILGLVLVLLGGSVVASLPWMVAAIVGVLMQRPDQAWLERWLNSGSQH